MHVQGVVCEATEGGTPCLQDTISKVSGGAGPIQRFNYGKLMAAFNLHVI